MNLAITLMLVWLNRRRKTSGPASPQAKHRPHEPGGNAMSTLPTNAVRALAQTAERSRNEMIRAIGTLIAGLPPSVTPQQIASILIDVANG